MPPASGLGVPTLSCVARRKNEMMSRVAAKPTPCTSGSFAVHTRLYASAGLKPSLRQMRVGSGRGVVRCVAHDVQLSHAQSVLGIVLTVPMTPSIVSDVYVV